MINRFILHPLWLFNSWLETKITQAIIGKRTRRLIEKAQITSDREVLKSSLEQLEKRQQELVNCPYQAGVLRSEIAQIKRQRAEDLKPPAKHKLKLNPCTQDLHDEKGTEPFNVSFLKRTLDSVTELATTCLGDIQVKGALVCYLCDIEVKRPFWMNRIGYAVTEEWVDVQLKTGGMKRPMVALFNPSKLDGEDYNGCLILLDFEHCLRLINTDRYELFYYYFLREFVLLSEVFNGNLSRSTFMNHDSYNYNGKCILEDNTKGMLDIEKLFGDKIDALYLQMYGMTISEETKQQARRWE